MLKTKRKEEKKKSSVVCFSFSLIKTAHDALPVLAYACAILCSRQTLTHGSQSCLAAVSRVKEEEKRTKKNRLW